MPLFVRRMRLELTRSCDHYPLKVACIPISPPALAFGEASHGLTATRSLKLSLPPLSEKTSLRSYFAHSARTIISTFFREATLRLPETPYGGKKPCGFFSKNSVPRTGLEPARLATYAPETYASTNSATWARGVSRGKRLLPGLRLSFFR